MRRTAMILLMLGLACAGCDDDKGVEAPAGAEKTDKTAKGESPPAKDEAPGDDETSGAEGEQKDAKPTYGDLADAYGELEAAYDELEEAPAGLAAQMREWGLQMQYMDEHDGHTMRDDLMDVPDEGMEGQVEDPSGGAYGPRMPAHMSGFDEWHRQMSDFHAAEAKERGQAGDSDLAGRHEMMAKRHTAMAKKLTIPEEREPVEVDEQALAEAGESLYVNACATCHAEDGTGVTRAFPPVAGADIGTGDPELLIRITLRGMYGPLRVGDQNYNGYMPSFAARFSNEEIAAILTYMRNSWGNEASAITPESVAEVRQTSKDTPGALSTIKQGLAPTVE